MTGHVGMQAPRTSVVIASIVGAPFLDDCLDSIEQQAKACGAEVIVVACGAAAYADAHREEVPLGAGDPPRRARDRAGSAAPRSGGGARRDVVAIIEEHCLAAPDWLRRAMEASRRRRLSASLAARLWTMPTNGCAIGWSTSANTITICLPGRTAKHTIWAAPTSRIRAPCF